MSNYLNKFYYKKGYRKKFLDLRVREEKKTIVFAILILILTISFCSLLFYTNLQKYASAITINPYFKHVSKIYQEDDIVISIASICSNFDEEEKQISCVNNFVSEFFTYEEHDEINLRLPKEIINNGGCCRDYTVFYDSIFKTMGYETEYVHEIRHVYLKVYGKDTDYFVDQGMIW